MIKIEIGILSRQALSDYMATRSNMILRVKAWESARNAVHSTINWQFTTQDARIRLKRLYLEV